ncbi:MAG TPA: GGDEF domain-containing protein, partial [Acidobacteriaceae bacterium]
FGPRRGVLLLTMISTLGSVLVSLALARMLGLTGIGYIYSSVIATIVPLIMVPLTVTRIVRLTFELEKARAQLHYLATHDSLTTAYNRSYFLSRFEEEKERAQKTNAPLSVMMIDADDFKSINDCYGHIGGDIALSAIARGIQQMLRPQDIFARYGGEEFIVLLPKTALSQACDVAERIRSAIAATRISIQEETISVTISIGLSCVERGSFSHMIDRADAALYEAKRNGRNRWAC